MISVGVGRGDTKTLVSGTVGEARRDSKTLAGPPIDERKEMGDDLL